MPVHVFVRKAGGALEEITSQATLTASDTGVADVEPGGVRVNAAGDAALVVRALGLAAWTRIEAADGADFGMPTLAPANLSLAAGHTLQLVLSALAPDGNTIDLTGAASYSIDAPTVAALLADGAGRLYGISPGSVNVTASIGSYSVATTVQVVPYSATRSLASIELDPPTVQTRVGRTAQLYAAARYDDGTVDDASASAAWHHDGDAIDRIVAGTLLPAKGGTSQVTATLGAESATVSATVVDIAETEMRPAVMQLPVGATQSLAFFVHFTDDLVYDLTAAADWGSDAPSLATVTGGSVQGVADGMTSIHANAFGRGATAAITVGNGGGGGSDGGSGTIVGLQITPPFATVGLGGAQAFSAIASFSDGSQETITGGVSWSAAAGATIDGSGVATASAAGTYGITASYGGQQAVATLTVTGVVATPTSLAVTPATLALSVGDTRTLVATAQYSDGTTRDVSAQVQWTSSSVAATITTGGQLSAHQTGSAVVTAQLGTLSATAQVTVQPALTGLTVYPTSGASVVAGLTVAMTATANYSDGTMVDITHSATWSTTNSAIATVSMGTATGHAAGSTLVTASWSGQSAQATLTVTAAKVTTLTVSGASSLNCESSSYSFFSATATFTDGTQRDVSTSASSPQVTWQLTGLTGYTGLYATMSSDELYCTSSCSTTCAGHYGYGSVTARAMNDDGTIVTSSPYSIQAIYLY